MGKPQPIAVGEQNAAHILDMTRAEFRSLVECGSLPGPALRLRDPRGKTVERWLVSDLASIKNGTAMRDEGIEF